MALVFSLILTLTLIYLSVSANNSLVIALAKHLRVKICISANLNINKVKAISQNFIFHQNYPAEHLFTPSGLDLNGNAMVLLQRKSLMFAEGKLIQLSPDYNWFLEIDDNELTLPLPVSIPFDRDFWVSEKQADFYKLSTVYQLRNHYPQIIEPYGNFTPKNGVSASLLLPSITRHNFHNISFVVFVPFPNICDFNSICAHYKMWGDFGRLLNFTQVDANPQELMTTYKGKFDGEAVHSPLHTTFGRDKNLLAVTLRGTVNIYIKDRLDSHSDTWLAFSKPFENAVWYCLAGWLVIASIILSIQHYLQGYSTSFIVQTAFTPIDAICNQGGSITTQTLLSRWSLLMPRILAVILYPAYAAAIISFITVNIPSVPFDSIIGLHDDGTYQVGSLKADHFSLRYFNDSPVPKLKEIGRRMQLPFHKTMESYEENLKYLCSKKYAFLAYDDIVDRQIKPCKIIKLANPVTSAYAGLSLAPNSSYKKVFKLILLKMHSSGYIHRITQGKTVKHRKEQERKLEPIAMPQVIVPFLIFGAGFVFSLLILSIEMIFHQRRSQTNPAMKRKHRRVILQRRMDMLGILLGFVALHGANAFLAVELAKHLSMHQLIVVENYDGLNTVQLVKNLSKGFVLGQVYELTGFRKAVSGLLSPTMVQISSDHLVEKDLIDFFPGKLNWLVHIDNETPFPYIPLDSEIWTTQFQNNFTQLNTIHQIGKNTPMITEPYGKYSEKFGLESNIPSRKPNILRRNFQGQPLIIFVPIPNILEFKTGALHYHLWQDFGMALNFTVVYVDKKELTEIYHGKYDGQAMVAPFHTITMQRKPDMPDDTFLAPILKGWVFMYVKDAFGTHGDNWLSYIRPFHTQVWICLAGWLLLFSLVIMILHHFFGYRISTIIETGLTPLDAICCQGATVPTASQKSRITAFMPQLVAAIIFPAYAAAIVSFLTVHIQTFPFEDIDGLMEDGTYRIGYLKVDLFCRALIQSHEEWRTVQVPTEELTDSYTLNMARLCRDRKFTFLGYNNLFAKEAKICKFLQIPSPLTFLFTGLPIPRDSPYLHALRWVLIKMHSNGMINRAKKEVAPVLQTPEQKFDPIPLRQVVVPFLILIIGVVLAPLLFICEYCTFHHSSTLPNRKRRIVVFKY